GKGAEAEALFAQTIELATRALGAEDSLTLTALADSASVYEQRGDYATAEARAAKALAGRRHAFGSDNIATIGSAADLALYYVADGKFADAEPLVRESLEFLRKNHPDEWQRFGLECLLGTVLAHQQKYSEAESLMLQGYRGMMERKDKMGAPAWFYFDRV